MEPIIRPRTAFGLLLGAGFIFSSASCSKKEIKKTSADDSLNVPMALVMGNPVDFGEKNMLLFPVGGNYNPDITNRPEPDERDGNTKTILTYADVGLVRNATSLYDKFCSAEYMNNQENDFDIRNILFYDQVTGTSHTLSGQSLHILSFGIHREFAKPLIFYRMVKKDTNKNKKFNSEDAVLFCISDIDGKNLKEVTPEDEQFIQYFYYKNTNTILIKTCVDSDKDGSYSMLDGTTFREVKLDAPDMGREIFSKAMKDSLKQSMLLN